MSLFQGREYLAIPGPSVVPDAVLRAMHRAAPNIYEGELIELTHSLVPDLRMVARTRHNVAIYIGNGHAAWEAALANVIAPGNRVLVPATGRFGHGWAEMATGIGAEAEIVDFGRQSPWSVERVVAHLAADKDHAIKAVLGVHVDTSTSARNDLAALREGLDGLGHPALLMADCIASLGCDRFEMDDWGVDVTVSACQKGLMTPPGLGFVFFNERAGAVRAGMDRVSRYWDWTPRAAPERFYEYFGGTAPTHHLYGLRAVLDMIRAEGIEAVWARHARLAEAIWAAVDTWATGGPLCCTIADRGARSHAVTSLTIGAPHGRRLREWVEAKAGVTLGIGLGMGTKEDPDSEGFFRFGHMGHVNAHMILGMLGTVDAGLKALDIPHGGGALEAASRVISAA